MGNKILENQYLTVFLNAEGHVRIAKKNGGVVVVPVCNGKYALIQHQREEQTLIEFPRGFLEPGESHLQGGLRELKEELNFNAENATILGDLVTDSGLINDDVKAVICPVNSTENLILQTEEGVTGCDFYTLDEIMAAVKQDKIKDNFTLATLMLLWAKRE